MASFANSLSEIYDLEVKERKIAANFPFSLWEFACKRL
jgi:hypothetical protein